MSTESLRKPNLFITGPPGIGKTTVFRKVVEQLTVPVRGFFTKEVRKEGRRVGFALETLEGDSLMFAHVNFRTRFRVGRYGVRVDILDDWGVKEIERGIEEDMVVAFDEIGKMELFSQGFRDAVIAALDSHSPVVATLSQHGAAFTEKVRTREDVKIARVSQENRDTLHFRILEYLDPLLQQRYGKRGDNA